MGCLNVYAVQCFESSLVAFLFDILYHLIVYLWTKKFKCCIKSANYVKLAYLQLF